MSGEPGLVSATQTHYDQIHRRYLRDCETGGHGPARGTTDRDGHVLWICVHCPAVREQGDPTWRTT